MQYKKEYRDIVHRDIETGQYLVWQVRDTHTGEHIDWWTTDNLAYASTGHMPLSLVRKLSGTYVTLLATVTETRDVELIEPVKEN